MRMPESLRDELQELNSVIASFGDRAEVARYPAALANLDLLEARRTDLVRQLGNAEISALTVLLEAPGIVGAGDINVDFLVSALGPLQETISSVGQALMDRATDRAPIPGIVRSATQLRVVGTFSGSFGLALAGPRVVQGDLFAVLNESDDAARPIFERAVGLVLDVIQRAEASLESGSSNEEILSLLVGIGSRAHGHLRSLASTFASVDAAARLTFNPPTSPQRTVTLRRPGARRLREVLDTTSIEESEVRVTGRLAGASTIRDNFELETTDGTVLRGRVDEIVRPLLREFFDSECTVTLRVMTARSEIDDTEALHYTLISIR
jgi:hypothetical protein